MKPAERKFIVFVSLAGILVVTSVVLLALAPAPLAPEAAGSLYAVDAADALDVVVQTSTPMATGRWKSIYVHHSKTLTGNSSTLGLPGTGLGDHFLIGNGEGTVDGEIQIARRWDQQQPAIAPAGAARIDDDCISICIVGDFDRSLPTPAQLRRLVQLVNALQMRLEIPADRVHFFATDNSPAAVGRYFHATAFRQQLLP